MILLFALLLLTTEALRTAVPSLRCVRQGPGRLRMASYEEMLAQARAARGARRAVPKAASSPADPQPIAPQPVTRSKAETAPAKASSSGLPFSDELYGHLKFCLEKLAARMKSDQPLSSGDLQRFRVAVNAIIEDLNAGGEGSIAPKVEMMTAPVISKVKENIPSEKRPSPPSIGKAPKEGSAVVVYEPGEEPAGYYGPPDKESPFSLFHGGRSTWAIEGMDKMDAETYYQKINERNTAIKQMRKQRGERIGSQSSEEYFEFLAKKNRSGQEEQQP